MLVKLCTVHTFRLPYTAQIYIYTFIFYKYIYFSIFKKSYFLVVLQRGLESRVALLESEMKILKTKNINQNEELKIVMKKLRNMNKTVTQLTNDKYSNSNGNTYKCVFQF